MLALAGIAIQPKGTYGRSADDVGEEELTRAQKTHFWAFTSFYFAAVVGALLFFIYVFAKAPVFGGQAECNSSTVYVMFGFDIVATNDVFRWIFAGGIIALLVGVLFSLAIWSGVACCWGSDCLRLVGGGGHDDGGRVRRWRFPFFLVGHVFASSYFIAMLELMIDRNTLGPGKDDWGFGQLLAVALLIGPLTEILSLLIGTVGGKEEDMPLMRRR
ncbi:hypothetical protein GMORB2_3519 [Geosmithia morbida]|uniref:Uncharacterized protein n=1 Tax=Geosmithia morbida TaxID=1094350 RepID=A0A9P4YQM7_9HYPO|nr:uncharacterized protein GMORB2_3519 [Geosmithia morbida]KAF4119831.1 hypothetical protein GMORB2_3519 [Geosmithia morbida]